MNLLWHIKIDFSTKLRDKIDYAYGLLESTPRTFAGIMSWYKLFFKEYVNEKVDWTPSFHTMIARGKDDCDGMAVLGVAALKHYLGDLRGLYKIYPLAFISESQGVGHAVGFAQHKVYGGVIVFDYGKIYSFGNINKAKEWFKDQYNAVGVITTEKIWNPWPPLSYAFK